MGLFRSLCFVTVLIAHSTNFVRCGHSKVTHASLNCTHSNSGFEINEYFGVLDPVSFTYWVADSRRIGFLKVK